MNRKNKVVNIGLAVLLVAGAFAAFAPSAQAQGSPIAQYCGTAIQATLTPSFTPPSGPIKPIIGTQTISGTVVYETGQEARSLTPVTITLDAKPEDASWATVTISPKTVDVNLEQSGATSKSIPVKITVAINKNAPAFAQQNIKVSASATEGTCVEKPTPKNDDILIQADFYQRYQAQFEKAIWQTGQNSQIAIPLTIQNFGNGDIEVRMTINEQTSGKLNVAPPAQVTVKSMIAGGDTDRSTINIDVQTPFKNGYTNQRDKLVLDLKGNSADDPEKAITDLQLNAVVQTQGVYVPGFEAVTMLTALLGAVYAARRLR